MKRVLGCLLLLILPSLAQAQSIVQPNATPVYTLGSRLDVTNKFATVAASATTLTITPASANYVYITAVEIMNCAGTTVTAAAPLSVTTTGLGGGITPVWTVGTTGTAGMCNPAVSSSYYIPIKSNTQGGAITFVTPTFTANQVVRVNVWYYEAP